MTEADWKEARHWEAMIAELILRRRADAVRVLRFCVACSREVVPLLPSESSRKLVETLQILVDEGDAEDDVLELCVKFHSDHAPILGRHPLETGSAGEHAVLAVQALTLALAPASLYSGFHSTPFHAAKALAGGARPLQAGLLLQEIFGNPFQEVAVSPEYLECNGGAVRRLLRAIRAERRFDDLPILADALEEAGCTDAALLSHCRDQAACHLPCCWALEALQL